MYFLYVACFISLVDALYCSSEILKRKLSFSLSSPLPSPVVSILMVLYSVANYLTKDFLPRHCDIPLTYPSLQKYHSSTKPVVPRTFSWLLPGPYERSLQENFLMRPLYYIYSFENYYHPPFSALYTWINSYIAHQRHSHQWCTSMHRHFIDLQSIALLLVVSEYNVLVKILSGRVQFLLTIASFQQAHLMNGMFKIFF